MTGKQTQKIQRDQAGRGCKLVAGSGILVESIIQDPSMLEKPTGKSPKQAQSSRQCIHPEITQQPSISSSSIKEYSRQANYVCYRGASV